MRSNLLVNLILLYACPSLNFLIFGLWLVFIIVTHKLDNMTDWRMEKRRRGRKSLIWVLFNFFFIFRYRYFLFVYLFWLITILALRLSPILREARSPLMTHRKICRSEDLSPVPRRECEHSLDDTSQFVSRNEQSHRRVRFTYIFWSFSCIFKILTSKQTVL